MKGTAPPAGLLKLRFSGFVPRTTVETPPISQLVLTPVWRSITVPSDVASRPPSDENASAAAIVSTPEVAGPAKLRRNAPSLVLQSVTSPISDDKVASAAPSGENATASIRPSGDASCATSVQLSVAMRRTVPAPVKAARRFPLGASVTLQAPSGPRVPHRVYACPAAAGASVSGATNVRGPHGTPGRAVGEFPGRSPCAPPPDASPPAAADMLPALPAPLPFSPSRVGAPPVQPPSTIAATAPTTFVALPIAPIVPPDQQPSVSKVSGSPPATRGSFMFAAATHQRQGFSPCDREAKRARRRACLMGGHSRASLRGAGGTSPSRFGACSWAARGSTEAPQPNEFRAEATCADSMKWLAPIATS